MKPAWNGTWRFRIYTAPLKHPNKGAWVHWRRKDRPVTGDIVIPLSTLQNPREPLLLTVLHELAHVQSGPNDRAIHGVRWQIFASRVKARRYVNGPLVENPLEEVVVE